MANNKNKKKKKTRRGNRGSKELPRAINQDEEVVFKVMQFANASAEGGKSKQMNPDVFETMIADGEVIRPLYDPLLWSMLLEQNTRLNRCVWAMSLNTVGLGFELAPLDASKEFVEENAENIKEERARIYPVFKFPNFEQSFEELMMETKIDEETIGFGYLEVSRNLKNEPDGFFHVPGHTVRVRADQEGYIQMRSTIGTDSYLYRSRDNVNQESDNVNKVYFKNFGDTRIIDKNTGEVPDKEIPFEQQANEMIMFKIYTPRSSYYGVPRYVAAAPSISGNRLAQLRNVSFFENDATPRMAVIVNGGNLDTQSVKMIEEFISAKGKGPMNFGRVMVLQAEEKEAVPEDSAKASIQLMPLTVGVTEDASFTRYLSINNEEVREAFGLGTIFLGTSTDVNRATAFTMKQVTMEQVFEPEIRRYEYRINATIMRALDAKYTKFRFKRPKIIDLSQEAVAYATLAQAGGVTPNDIRRLLELDPFQGEWANTPIPLVELGVIEGQPMPALEPKGNDDTEKTDEEGQVFKSLEDVGLQRIEGLYNKKTGKQTKLKLLHSGEAGEVLEKLKESIGDN